MKRMTNREYMITLLSDDDAFDDGGASYEAMVYYNINCPYNEGDARAHCCMEDYSFINRDNCFHCKQEWLESEVDE